MNLNAGFPDEAVVFFLAILLIIQRKGAFFFPIFSLKYWRHPCFHDVLNLFHVVFGLLNSLFQVMNAIGYLHGIIPNACSPKEIELTEMVHGGGKAEGLCAMMDGSLCLKALGDFSVQVTSFSAETIPS